MFQPCLTRFKLSQQFAYAFNVFPCGPASLIGLALCHGSAQAGMLPIQLALGGLIRVQMLYGNPYGG